MADILQLPRKKQPELGAPLNLASPLARALIGAWLPTGGGYFDHARAANHALTKTGSPAMTGAPRNGQGVQFAAGQYFDAGSGTPVPTAGMTVAAWVRFATTPNSYGMVITREAGSGTAWELATNATTRALYYYGGGTLWTGSPAVDTDWHLWCFSLGGGRQEVYLDGKSHYSVGDSPVYNATGAVHINRRLSGTYAGNHGIGRVYVFDRALSGAEAVELYRDEWQIFEPRKLLVSAAAAASGNTVSVPAGALNLTGFAPTVSATAHQTIGVPAGALTLTGFAPLVTAADNKTVSVPSGSLFLTGFVPTVSATANWTISVPSGSLTLTGFAPAVSSAANQTISVPAGSLTLTGFAPGVAASTNYVSVPAGAIVLTGFAPSVSNGTVVLPPRRVYKLNEQPQLGNDLASIRLMTTEHLSRHAQEVNRMKAGMFSVRLNTATTAPTGTGAPGDFVANEAPEELGTASSKYVIEGWMCLSDGSWTEKRFLTGN